MGKIDAHADYTKIGFCHKKHSEIEHICVLENYYLAILRQWIIAYVDELKCYYCNRK